MLVRSSDRRVHDADPWSAGVRILPYGDARRFIDAEEAPYTYSPEYVEHLQRSSQIVMAVSRDGSVTCLVRLWRVRFLRFGQLLSPPWRPGSPLMPEAEGAFVSSLLTRLATERLCDRLIQPAVNELFRSFPPRSQFCHFGSYVLPLQDRSEDELFAGLHGDHRRKIRTSLRAGAEVRFGRDEVAPFARLHARCMEGSGVRPGSEQYFQELFDALEPAGHVLCGLVYYRGVPMAGAFVPYTRRAGYYLAGGSAAQVTLSGAVKLLHWEIIRRLRALGVEKYDFLGARLSDVRGTKLESIQRFKARFGCDLHRGYLWKMDVRPAAGRAWDALSRANAWLKRRPAALPDLIDQERAKIRPGTSGGDGVWSSE